MVNLVIARLIAAFVDKKKIIGWISAAAIAIVAAGMGMQSTELKSAICGVESAVK